MARIKRGVFRGIERLPIDPVDSGDWIEIKKVLSSGERGDVLDYSIRSVSTTGPDGKSDLALDYGKQKFALAAAYVTGWNLVDQDEKPIPYVLGTFEARLAQIRALDDPTVDAINKAIQAYEARLGNAPASESSESDAGAPTSPSHT